MILALAAGAKMALNDYESMRLVREKMQPAKPDNPEAVYKFEQGNISHVLLFSGPANAKWSYGPWSSDAQLFYLRSQDGCINRVVVSDASFVQFRGAPLISHQGPLQWLEWSYDGKQEHVACSDPAAVRGFAGDILSREMI